MSSSAGNTHPAQHDHDTKRALDISAFAATIDRPKGLKKLEITPEVYVVVIIDDQQDQTRMTRPQRSRAPSWNESFTLFVHESSTLEIQVWESHTIRSKRTVGTCKGAISQLMNDQEDVSITENLKTTDAASSNSKSTITFHLSFRPVDQSSQTMLAADAVRRANEDTSLMHGPSKPLQVIEDVMESTQATLDATQPLGSLVARLEKFANVTESLAKVHPYAQTAWNILSAVYKVVQAQEARDAALDELLQTMSTMLGFVEESEAVSKIRRLEDTVTSMAKQIEECAKFIRDYASTTNFVLRTLRNMVSDTDKQMADFKASFELLHRSFDSNINISTARSVMRINQELTNMNQNLVEAHFQAVLDKLLVASASWNSDHACLEGTREPILGDITRWVYKPMDDKTGNKPLLLTGVAGSGKSSIANSAAQRFKDMGMLGSTFFFDRADATNNRNAPHRVISTMARDLAAFDPEIAQSIYVTLKKDPSLADTTDLRRQFEHLLLGPARNARTDRIVVLIIDALDECSERNSFLELLTSQWHRIPVRFRLILTARPQGDILEIVESSVFRCTLPSSDDNTLKDIDLFVKERLGITARRKKLGKGWPSELDRQALVNMSSGLFIWIKTVCDMLDARSSPKTELQKILDNKGKLAGNIDQVYITALEEAHDWNDEEFSRAFHVLMGIIMTAKTPLSLEAIAVLAELQELDPNVPVATFLRPLGCLLTGLDGAGLVQMLHPSFHDFLTTPNRPPERFFIDKTKHNAELALGCLTVLNNSLKRNICEIADETMPNVEVPGLADLIRSRIPEALQYSARFAIYHLVDVPIGDTQPSLISCVQELLLHHLLEWLEVLSLLNSLDMINSFLLRKVDRWLQNIAPKETLRTLLYDTDRFLLAFRDLVTKHALQVHSSALLFTPSGTLLRTQYKTHGRVVLNLPETWSRLLSTMEGHTKDVWRIVFSPDGKRLASCSEDKTIRLWDANSGAAIGEPLVGHAGCVWDIVFSPDGMRLASRSSDKTVRLWDAHSGAAIGEPLVGHAGFVLGVVFSPDGTRLASCCWGRTIRLWDGHSGAAIGQPLVGHTGSILGIAFSPDGMQLASCSSDKTVRLWDAHSGVAIGEPLLGHTGRVLDIVFSPDGTRLASRSEDKTIRLWNAHGGAAVGQPLVGHTGFALGTVFSPDGMQLASCSRDKTVRLWDAHSGAAVGEPLVGHTGYVSGIVFSSDGMRIASCSWDKTVRLWDARSGAAIGEPLVGHTGDILSIVFSPDGMRLASCSRDKTVRLWDAHSGHAIDDVSSNFSWNAPYSWLTASQPAFIDDNGWLVFRSSRLVWIPSEYRGTVTLDDDTFMIGSFRGTVVFIRL